MQAIERIPQLPALAQRHWQHYLVDTLLAVVGALVITLLIYVPHLYPAIPNISIVYLLIILILASTRGRYAAIACALVAFLSFDFFLVPPLYTLTIGRSEEWLALFVFLAVALLASQLATVMRENAEEAKMRERETRILYEMGRVANSTDSIEDQLDIIALSTERVFSPWGVRESALLLPDADGTLRIRADAPIRIEDFTLSPAEMHTAELVMQQGEMLEVRYSSGGATPEAILRLLPLKRGHQILGVLCLRIEGGSSWFTSEQVGRTVPEQSNAQATFFSTFLDQVVSILERAHLRAGTLASDNDREEHSNASRE
jgi:K+-sensing histidine kinase KdpD